MSKTIWITGASSGIGLATARVFAEAGNKLLLSGRREERLIALQAELSPQVSVEVLVADVRDRAAWKSKWEQLSTEFQHPDFVFLNAGNAHGLDPIHEGNPEDWDLMIDINIKGILNVIHICLPSMVARKQGHLLLMGSIAGKENYPKGNVYCATKHAVDSLAQSLRMDLNPLGIKVSAIHPGMVETEFSLVRFKGDNEKAQKVYEGFQPLRPEDVADVVKYMVNAPAHVHIADLTLLPSAQASATLVHKST